MAAELEDLGLLKFDVVYERFDAALRAIDVPANCASSHFTTGAQLVDYHYDGDDAATVPRLVKKHGSSTSLATVASVSVPTSSINAQGLRPGFKHVRASTLTTKSVEPPAPL